MMAFQKTVFLMGLCALVACGEDSGVTNIKGVLQGVQTSLILPQDPLPSILVLGRDIQEFETAFDVTTLGHNQATFTMKNLPKDQELVFETSGAGLEQIISYPTLTSKDNFRLPALLAGSIGNFIDLAEDPSGPNITVDLALGMVSGILSASQADSPVSGTAAGSVRLIGKQNNTVATNFGPYYFTGETLSESGGCPNAICAYIFFNVPEGVYRFQTLGPGNSVTSERDVVVLASRLSFGIE